MTFPAQRLRRLRQNPAMRNLVAETRLSASSLILPAFVREGLQAPREISSMPGVYQHTLDSVARAAHEAVQAGVGGMMLFGVPAQHDAMGSGGIDPAGILNRAIARVRAEVGDGLVVMSDVCLDEFTDHGHCGVLGEDGRIDNDATLEIYADMALAQAEAGAHMLGPSGKMDGEVSYIRQALEKAGYIETGIFAYSAKYASAFYGPFREAVNSQLTGDRRTYQMDPRNRREAFAEVRADIEEGADLVMVKPAMTNLDILGEIASFSSVPVGAYQISGEYSMIEAASARGWLERRSSILEALTSITRAGAETILTYWATEAATWIREDQGR